MDTLDKPGIEKLFNNLQSYGMGDKIEYTGSESDYSKALSIVFSLAETAITFHRASYLENKSNENVPFVYWLTIKFTKEDNFASYLISEHVMKDNECECDFVNGEFILKNINHDNINFLVNKFLSYS